MRRRHLAIVVCFLTAIVAGYSFAQRATSQPAGEDKIRLFEIRTYTTEPGKLAALNARFRDHTTRLFEKHGMTNIGYWTPAEGPRSEDTLIYVLAHDSRAAADKSWQAFRTDPNWLKARGESEAAGPIVKKVESVFVTPTDYSPLK
ncbi:MAG TPA: NIPSNAP family protein [Lacipirellulaceae bacterium]